MNLKEAHKLFVEDLKRLGRAKSTLIAYGKDIEQLIDFMEKKGVTDAGAVGLEDLQAFMDHFAEKGYTNKTISRKTNSTKTFFGFLKEKGYINEDVSEYLKHPDVKPSPPRILSRLEYRALRDSTRGDLRTYALIEVFLQTGISISEISGIELGHLHLEEEKPYLFIPARGSKDERTVPLNEVAVAAIERYMEKERTDKGSAYLFTTRTGNPMLVRNIRSTVNRYFEKAGVENATVNDLRHTFVAHQLQGGVNLTFLSRIVGHKRVSTTERYLDFVDLGEDGVGSKSELEVL